MTNKNLVKLMLQFAVGITFLISAYSKLITPGIVEIIIVDHGFAETRETAAVFVRILIALEFAIGFMYLQHYYLKKIIIPVSFLFIFCFTAYLVYTGFVLGDNQSCGCFGTMIEMSPVESIIKNAILAAVIFAVYKLNGPDKKNIFVPIIILFVSIAGVFAVSPVKSPGDFKFNEFTNFIGKGRVDLAEGDKLIAVMNTECDHCAETAAEFSLLKNRMENKTEFYALFFSEGDLSIDSFKTITGFDVPYAEIDVGKFFDLIGSEPPRVYWLSDGELKGTWDENFTENIKKNFGIK